MKPKAKIKSELREMRGVAPSRKTLMTSLETRRRNERRKISAMVKVWFVGDEADI